MLYPAPGNILDWMYAREAVKYSYVAHLRDTGTVSQMPIAVAFASFRFKCSMDSLCPQNGYGRLGKRLFECLTTSQNSWQNKLNVCSMSLHSPNGLKILLYRSILVWKSCWKWSLHVDPYGIAVVFYNM